MPFSLRCPACRGKFPWNPSEGMPDNCVLCGEYVGTDRADDDVVMPFVRSSARTKSIDQVYRDMEKGSEVRAQAAADMVGAPVSEMSSLKITDMRDNQREGDTALAPVNNSVTQVMAQAPQAFGFGGSAGSEFARGTRQGPHPNAGARFMQHIHKHHQG